MANDWTHKLGYVVPSWNTVVEYETTRMLPAGVSAHFSRIAHTDDSPASLRHMAEPFPASVELLSHAKVDVVCYACTGASLFRGRRDDLADIARLGLERDAGDLGGGRAGGRCPASRALAGCGGGTL